MAHAYKLSVRAKFFAVIAVVIFLGVVSYAALAASAEAFVPILPTVDHSPTLGSTSTIDLSAIHKDKLKSLQNDIEENIRRRLSDVKRVAKDVNTTTIDTLLNQWESCIQARQADVGKDVFNTNMEECLLLNQMTRDEFNKNIIPQIKCAETKKRINEYKKEKKNMERQIKDFLRGDKTRDMSVFKGIISRMDEPLAKADTLSCNSDVRDSLEQISKELGDLSVDFSNARSDLQNQAQRNGELESMMRGSCGASVPRSLNKLEKEMKAKAKKYPAIYGDATSKINDMREIHNQRCGDLLNQIKAALQNNDTDAYNDARSTFNDLGRDFDDIQASFYEADRQLSDIENVKNIGKELKKQISELKARKKGQLLKYKKAFAQASKKVISSEDQKKNLDAFDEYIGQADELLAKMTDGLKRTKLAQNNPDSALVEEIQKMQNEYSETQQEWLKLTNIMTRLVPGIEGMMIVEPFGGLESIRRATNNDPELMSVLDGIASQANDLLNQAWVIAITSPDEALDILMSRQDLHIDWTDATDSWKESHGIEEFDYSGGQPSNIPSSSSMDR